MYSVVIATSGGQDSFYHFPINLLICRLVKEYEDPSLVPEYWICSMNEVKKRVGFVDI
jgi:hypothetical protein